MSGNPPGRYGELIAFNLTLGGPMKEWPDGEIFRVIRQGMDRDGRRFITMSNLPVRHLSDDDIAAVIAYLRGQPAMPNPPKQGNYPNLLLAVFVGANLVPRRQVPLPEPSPHHPKARRWTLGSMSSRTTIATIVTGGKLGGLTPVVPTLRLIKGWTRDQLITTLRTGTDPSGHVLDATKMFWKTYRNLDDDELGAVFEYLRGLP